MASCYRCGGETHLYDNETPVCVACLDAPAARTEPAWDTALPNDTHLRLPHD